jgi:Flp pilus assembly pilin Flp
MELRTMGHRAMGRLHAELAHTLRRLADERGQGTVEYVALIILMALLLAAVVTAVRAKGDAGIATTIVDKLKAAIDGVGDPPGRR